ncbi:MAG: hypothetical protein GWO22_10025, partial [Actinobacteria bacterium]|nr:hypothetical protein [Actinomycetota bacterium]
MDAQGTTSADGLFTVDGQRVDPPQTTFVSAPFVPHTLEAAAGEEVAPGERHPFLDWLDDPAASRARSVATPLVDSTFVARYGGTQYELTLTTTGGVNAVEPATFQSDPPSGDLWFDADVQVTLEALPRTGFAFLAWSGALAGQANPATFAMSSPLAAGADFELVYAIAETSVGLPAATTLEVQLQVENGTPPVSWSVVGGTLPTGVRLSRTGLLSGASLDLGRFDVTVQAVDASGLPASADIALDFLPPSLSIEQLVSPFLLSGPPLTDEEINFLNRQGNRVAPYDVGDFRAWVLADPTLPLSAEV